MIGSTKTNLLGAGFCGLGWQKSCGRCLIAATQLTGWCWEVVPSGNSQIADCIMNDNPWGWGLFNGATVTLRPRGGFPHSYLNSWDKVLHPVFKDSSAPNCKPFQGNWRCLGSWGFVTGWLSTSGFSLEPKVASGWGSSFQSVLQSWYFYLVILLAGGRNLIASSTHSSQ